VTGKERSEDLLSHVLDLWRKTGKISCLPATGDSMAPLIGPNSVLEVVHCEPKALKAGDIALIHNGKTLVVHRLVYRQIVGGRVFWAEKGDNSSQLSFIPEETILGRVKRIENNLGERWVDRGLHRLINRLIGVYWKPVIRIFGVKRKISEGASGDREHSRIYLLGGRWFYLQYIPKLLTNLCCRRSKS